MTEQLCQGERGPLTHAWICATFPYEVDLDLVRARRYLESTSAIGAHGNDVGHRAEAVDECAQLEQWREEDVDLYARERRRAYMRRGRKSKNERARRVRGTAVRGAARPLRA